MIVILSSQLMVAITLLVTKLNVMAQNEGDVRLVNNVKDILDTFQGRLEIFIDGKWGTVCGTNGTDLKAVADTACRQLGLTEAAPIFSSGTVTELGYPIAPDSTPIHFGSINCPLTPFVGEMCSPGYSQHILRCEVVVKVNTSICTHNNDIGVCCSTENITSNSYESQVALYPVEGQHFVNLSLSSGILGIFFDKSSKPGVVCGEGFDKSAADTACRQLGYTNANNFNTSLQMKKQTFWDAGLDCKSQSHSCLDSCFTKTPNNHTTCTNLVSLSCEFDLFRKTTESAGSPRLCDAAVDKSCNSYYHTEEHIEVVVVVVFVVVILAIIATCTTCITLLVCCLVPGCLIHCKRSGYKSISPN